LIFTFRDFAATLREQRTYLLRMIDLFTTVQAVPLSRWYT